MDRHEYGATAVGYIVASFVPVVSFTGISWTRDGWNDDTPFGIYLIIAGYIYGFSILLALLFGLPIFALLYRFRPLRWWIVAGVGGVFGALTARMLQQLSLTLFADVGVDSAIGALTALTFWLIWKRGYDADRRAAT